MKLLDLTLNTPEANLALDEALLEQAEAGESGEILRLWESPVPMVVLGRSSKAAEEVDLEECGRRKVSIGRRSSGGATIVTGPGCLMYAVVLSYETYPATRMLDEAHRTVLDRMVAGLSRLEPKAQRQGTSDLAIGQEKFSGNSLRCRRTHFLYHGTLLYDFDLPMIGGLLGIAPRQPNYRNGRDHEAFVCNFPASANDLRKAIIDAWPVTGTLPDWPSNRVEDLVSKRYDTDAWRFSR